MEPESLPDSNTQNNSVTTQHPENPNLATMPEGDQSMELEILDINNE